MLNLSLQKGLQSKRFSMDQDTTALSCHCYFRAVTVKNSYDDYEFTTQSNPSMLPQMIYITIIINYAEFGLIICS